MTEDKIKAIQNIISKIENDQSENLENSVLSTEKMKEDFATLKKHRNYFSPVFTTIATLFGRTIATKGEKLIEEIQKIAQDAKQESTSLIISFKK